MPDTPIIVGIAIGAFVLLVPFVLLALWLGAKGQMMSIRAVATGSPAVSEHWNQTKAAASSFFKFHVVLGLVSGVLVLPIALGLLYFIFEGAKQNDPFASLAVILALVAVLFVICFPLAIVSSIARNFVAPIMLKKELPFREAWRDFMTVAKGNWGKIIVFWFIRFGFSICAGIASMIVTVFTCCLGALPIVNQTLMAPWHAFERAHTLFILRSIGADYNLISMPDEEVGGGGYGGGYAAYGTPSPGPYGGPVPPAGGYGGYNPPYS